MKVELSEAQWLHEQAEISIQELAEASKFNPRASFPTGDWK